MYVTEAQNLFTTMVADLGTMVFYGLTAVLGLVAVLMGLFYAISLAKKWIGRGK